MSKNVAIDQESMLVVYADWIAFLREKKGQFESQLAKLQGKGGKAQSQPTPVVPPVEPAPNSVSLPSPETSMAPLPEDSTAPAWLFETTSPPEAEAASAVSPSSPSEEVSDAWL